MSRFAVTACRLDHLGDVGATAGVADGWGVACVGASIAPIGIFRRRTDAHQC